MKAEMVRLKSWVRGHQPPQSSPQPDLGFNPHLKNQTITVLHVTTRSWNKYDNLNSIIVSRREFAWTGWGFFESCEF